MILNPAAGLQDQVRGAINRYTAGAQAPQVFVMGGVAAMTQQVTNDLVGAGYPVRRVAGDNRFSTAVAAAQAVDLDYGSFTLADGGSYPFALIASAAASIRSDRAFGVLLTDGGRMPAETQAYLDSISGETLYPIGGGSVAATPGWPGFDTDDPYVASAEVAAFFFRDYASFGLASGEAFPDGLAGSAHAGRYGIPLLLTRRTEIPQSVVEEVARAPRDTMFIYGGTSAIDNSVRSQIGRFAVHHSCSFVAASCQATYSRVLTRQICDDICPQVNATPAVIAAAAAAACRRIGGPRAAAVCGVVAGTVGVGIINDVREASENNHCIGLRFLPRRRP